jgi:hypothetical protein
MRAVLPAIGGNSVAPAWTQATPPRQGTCSEKDEMGLPSRPCYERRHCRMGGAGRHLRSESEVASVGRRSADQTHQPAIVTALEDHRHLIRVARSALVARCGLGPLGEEPRERSGNRHIATIPLPRVGRVASDVAVEEAAQLVGSAKQRLLGRDDDQVGLKGADGKGLRPCPCSRIPSRTGRGPRSARLRWPAGCSRCGESTTLTTGPRSHRDQGSGRRLPCLRPRRRLCRRTPDDRVGRSTRASSARVQTTASPGRSGSPVALPLVPAVAVDQSRSPALGRPPAGREGRDQRARGAS